MRSLKWKLTGIISLAIIAWAAILSLTFYAIISWYDLTLRESRLVAEASLFRELISNEYRIPEDNAGWQILAQRFASQSEARVTVIDQFGVVLADSEENYQMMANHATRPEIEAAAKEGLGISRRFSLTQKQDNLDVAVSFQAKPDFIGFIRLAAPTSVISAPGWTALQIFGGILALAAILLIAFVYRTESTIIEPISALIRWSRSLSRGGFDRDFPSIQLQRPDEIGDLGKSMEHMAGRFQNLLRDLRQNQQKLEAVMNNTSSGILLFNGQGKLDLYNPAAEHLLGVSGIMTPGLLPTGATRNSQISILIEEALNSKQRITSEIILPGESGRILQINIVPVTGDSSSYAGCLVVIYDITTLRRLERIRTDFVANASHELRTPLAAIRGFAETLIDTVEVDPASAREFAKIICDESARLERIVQELLELARIESTVEKKPAENIDLVQPILEVITLLRNSADEADLQIVFAIPDHPVYIVGDYDYIKRILLNLLENAIAFSPAGSKIEISLTVLDSSVEVAVKDQGPGIPEAELTRIFERFFRVERSRSRNLGGTGLGLSIVRHLVEAQEGKVWATSQVGQGSTFTFAIPRSKQL